jgi:hypothetical protein
LRFQRIYNKYDIHTPQIPIYRAINNTLLAHNHAHPSTDANQIALHPSSILNSMKSHNTFDKNQPLRALHDVMVLFLLLKQGERLKAQHSFT